MTKFTGILLAAGSAKRFGAPKLLHPLPDGTPIAKASAKTLVTVLPKTLAVVKPGDSVLIEMFSELGLTVIENSLANEGMGKSIASGVNASSDADGWLIMLADMPWIQPATILTLVERLKKGASMVAPEYTGRRGHPVGFSSRWLHSLCALEGDRGARDLIADNPDALELIITQDAAVLWDIDFPQDLS